MPALTQRFPEESKASLYALQRSSGEQSVGPLKMTAGAGVTVPRPGEIGEREFHRRSIGKIVRQWVEGRTLKIGHPEIT